MKKHILYILILCITGNFLNAQTIFYDDFGTPSGRVTAQWAAVGQNAFIFADSDLVYTQYTSSDYEYWNAKNIENNHYAVVAPQNIYTSVPDFNATSFYKVWQSLPSSNDADGNANGGVMVINAGLTPGVFYKRPIQLERGKYYKLTYYLWVENGNVQLRTNMHDSTGQKGLGYNLTSTFGTAHSWQMQTQYFYLPVSDCTDIYYTISLQNHNLVNNGNDFAIDNVKLEEIDASEATNVAIVLAPCDVEVPTADDDEMLNQSSGNVTVDVLTGDYLNDGTTGATASNIYSFDFVVPQGAMLYKSQWSTDVLLYVPGEGVWKYSNGNVTFYPGATMNSYGGITQGAFTFTGNPTPIQYTITQELTSYSTTDPNMPANYVPVRVTSEPATITVTYTGNPVANDDVNATPYAPISNGTAYPSISLLANDTTGTGTQATTSNSQVVSFVNPSTGVTVPVSSGTATIEVPGQGTWTYDAATDALTFTPEVGFTGSPDPLSYKMSEIGGTATSSAYASIEVSESTSSSSVVATNDTYTVRGGDKSTGSILDNDTVDGNAATTSNVTITQNSTTNSGVNIDLVSGKVVVDLGTPDGTYTITYTIQDANGNTSTATVTVTVGPEYCDLPSAPNGSWPVNSTGGYSTYAKQLLFFDWSGVTLSSSNPTATKSVTYKGVTYTATISDYTSSVSGATLTGNDINTWPAGPDYMFWKYYDVNSTTFKEMLYSSAGGTATVNLSVTATKNGVSIPVDVVIFDPEATDPRVTTANPTPESLKYEILNNSSSNFSLLEHLGTNDITSSNIDVETQAITYKITQQRNGYADGTNALYVTRGLNPQLKATLQTYGGTTRQGVSLAVRVECPEEEYCYKNPVTNAGTTVPTNHGITSLGRAGSDNGNWPMVRQSAWTVLESHTKGFVVNRMEFGTDGNPVGIATANFVKGMMVYDTTNHCLKIYDGTQWGCLSTQTCPE